LCISTWLNRHVEELVSNARMHHTGGVVNLCNCCLVVEIRVEDGMLVNSKTAKMWMEKMIKIKYGKEFSYNRD